ncbi:hypothetical protein DVH05_005829 [Phytophthora capsici]|nr:hypothetical protein DVH05_005829 [Phytophthora capsici]
MYRGRKARREVTLRRRTQHLTKVAVIIPRRYRGRLGRATFIRRRLDRARNIAATGLDKLFVGLQLLTFKGCIGGIELKLLVLRERNRYEGSSCYKYSENGSRRRIAIHRVKRLRQERVARFVLQAHTWVEYWSEWFYYNQETGEALWAPPFTGYADADGKLVL